MTQLTSSQTGLLATPSAVWAARFSDFAQLTKLRITFMVALTAFLGYAIAIRTHHGLVGIGTITATAGLSLWATLIGTSLSCMGAAALNQLVERDVDTLMPRTADRPLPAGRAAPAHALLLGVSLSMVGVAVLAAGANLLTAALSAFTILSYVFIYTPLKRVTSVSTIVGAVPGALPPVMGYAAATGRIETPAVLMFAIMFLWQLPHFLAIAWLYRDDYARASMPVLPVLDPTGASTFRQMLLGCAALLPLGLMPTITGVSGSLHFHGALIAGAAFLASAALLIVTRSRRHARLTFFVSLIYLPAVFALMLIDQV